MVFQAKTQAKTFSIELPPRGRTKNFTFKITNDLDKFEMGWEVAVSVAVLVILGCMGTIPALFLSYSEKLIKKQLEEELKELDRRQSIETTKRKLTSIREEEEGEIEGQNDNGTEMTILPITGTNCIKIRLPGKLIISKRKGLLEVLFS